MIIKKLAKVGRKSVSVGGDASVINNYRLRFSPIVPVLATNILAAYTISIQIPIFQFGEEIDITLFGCKI